MVTGLVCGYGVFTTHFAASPEVTFQVEKMHNELAHLEQEKAKLAYQFEDFRQNAALHWPEARKRDYRWPASITIDLSTSLYEKGRRFFQEKKFDESLKVFTQIQTDFPYSKWVVESYYYSCEINFKERVFCA
jgi:TolA-binding protein